MSLISFSIYYDCKHSFLIMYDTKHGKSHVNVLGYENNFKVWYTKNIFV